YSFGYTNFLGFALGYCKAGGKITERQWVPLGTKDFASIIAALPDDVDALYIGLGGGDAVNFLNQYQQAGGDAHLIGGSIMVDGTVLSAKGDAKKALIGTPSSGPQADTWDDPKWQAYVKAYQDAFPPEKRFPIPSLLGTGYYNAANAAIECLNQVNGDLSDGQAAFRTCLSNLELDAPNGKIKLDGNRQAIGSNFVIEVVEQDDGNLATKMVKKIDNVNQTLGLPEDEFRAMGLPSRDIVECN
ncbi:MAG: ABC transporter substrate-binding protein, partial [Nitratireductor sp.]|nr:ABC transporter substrate-binding protein [Nitratireductor sp.]